jgi:hypothetical protein
VCADFIPSLLSKPVAIGLCSHSKWVTGRHFLGGTEGTFSGMCKKQRGGFLHWNATLAKEIVFFFS